MKVWAHIPGTIESGFVDVQFGQEVTVFRCGSGHSKFGERAHLARVTSQHLVFVTERQKRKVTGFPSERLRSSQISSTKKSDTGIVKSSASKRSKFF